jgi:hypothetical protein
MKRTRGSVRFEPYYKIDRYDTDMSVWRPVGGTYPSIADAQRAIRVYDDGARYRLLEVTMHGKTLLPA